jgi:predicted Zn-dependent protease
LFTLASDAAPTDADYLAARAEALFAAGRAVDALDLLESRVPNFDDDARLRSLAGAIYRTLGMDDVAAERFRQAVSRSGSDAEGQRELGFALAAAGKDVQAVGILAPLVAAAAAEKPLSPADGSPAVKLTLARCQYRLGLYPQARQCIRSLLKNDPHDSQAWLLSARISIDEDDWTSARSALDRLDKGRTATAEVQLLIAYVSLRLRDYDAAANAARIAARIDSQDPTSLCLLGQIHEARGAFQEARDAYVQAVSRDPDCRLARELLAQLSHSTPNADAPEPSPPLRGARADAASPWSEGHAP